MIAVYTVFAPKAGPMKMNPTTSSIALMAKVITDIGNGIKLESTMARAASDHDLTWYHEKEYRRRDHRRTKGDHSKIDQIPFNVHIFRPS